jgi:DNA-binding transcriptional regulator YhcF (GntR family)
LQNEGLIEPVRGTGLQVAEGAAEKCRQARSLFVRDRLRAAIDEARQTKLDAAEIEAILREEWTKGNGSASGADGRGA